MRVGKQCQAKWGLDVNAFKCSHEAKILGFCRGLKHLPSRWHPYDNQAICLKLGFLKRSQVFPAAVAGMPAVQEGHAARGGDCCDNLVPAAAAGWVSQPSRRRSGKNLDESLTCSKEETPFPNRLCTQQVTLKAPGSLAESLLISKRKKKKERNHLRSWLALIHASVFTQSSTKSLR